MRHKHSTDKTRFSLAPPKAELPEDYANTLDTIKRRIRQERLRTVLSANSAMVLLYWDLGNLILERQKTSGWGTRIIDRMAYDLDTAFPEMRGFSPRNLKYMRAFTKAWPDRPFVQRSVAQIPWTQNLVLLDKLKDQKTRLWYIRQSLTHGWSRDILSIQINSRAITRAGKATTNFKDTLPPAASDMAAQIFKDPYLFDFWGLLILVEKGKSNRRL